ncbi:MAG TPA: S1C family serine protease [Polyangiaceae bacterium]|nr:S1C family serine protease [Polyangiaceae bacterium]
MKRSLLLSASVALAHIALPSPAWGHPQSPEALPPLPGSEATPAEGKSVAAPSAGSPQQLYEHVRRSVVALERNGVPLAIGTVLDGDGRILTSLSGLGGADGADVRYADGTTVRAKIGNGDKATDLALLVPQSNKWTEGLAASESDPVGAPLRAMLPSHGYPRLGPAEAGVKGHVDAHARDGAPLQSMLDVDVKGPLVAGAPLLDGTGSVVAVLVRACKGASAVPPDTMPWAAWGAAQEAAKAAPPACTPVVVGAPVSAIRSFLAKAPPAAVSPAAWIGIRGEHAQTSTVRGVRVVAVAPSGPAQKSGLKAGADVIVAADGHPIETPDALAEAIGKHAPGETVKLLVFGDDKFRDVAVVLRAAP